MAETIKGLNIVIGAETTGLEKALSGVNKQSRDIQSELKQIQKLLKLDPGNTELIGQKQKLLASAISNTKEKLSQLKVAQQQVNEQFKKGEINEGQYRAFQREVEKTKQELKGLQKELGNVKDKWKETGDSINNFGKKTSDIGKSLMPITLAAAGAGIAVTKMSSDFTDAIAKISTVADTTEVPLDQMRKSIMELSNQTGISANEIANNVYDAISAGQKTGDAVAFVGQTTKLAKAGFAEASQSLDLLTTIMNAYGLSADQAGKVSDTLIQVQNKGKVTVGELSEVMGKIIPTANAVGVGLDQIGAGYAILTSNGIKAAEATTYMNSMLNEFGKTGTTVDEKLKELTGKSFKQLVSEGKSISDVLKILDDNAKKSGLSLSDMFGSAEASKAALTLLGKDVTNFNNMVKDMNGSLGATDDAFEKLQTPGEKARVAFNKLQNAMIQLGDVILPILVPLAEAISGVASSLAGMDEGTRTVIVIIGALLVAIGPVFSAIQGLTIAISGIITLFGSLGAAITAAGGIMAVLTGPVGIAIAAIAALGAITFAVIKNWEAVKTFFVGIWNWLGNFFTEWGPTILAIIAPFLGIPLLIAQNWDSIKEFFNGLWTWLGEYFSNLGADFMRWGQNIIDGLVNGIKSGLDNAKNAIVDVGNNINDNFCRIMGINSPSKVMKGFGQYITEGLAIGIKDKISEVSKSMAQVKNTITGGFEKAKTTLMGFFGNLKDGFMKHVVEPFTRHTPDAVKKASSSVVSATGTIKKAFDKMKEAINDKKYFDQISLKEELEMWEKLQSKYKEGTEERKEADKEVYRLKKELVKESYDYSKQWIDNEKYYNRLSLNEELAAWERVQARYKEGTTQRKEADKEVYRVKKEINENMKKLEDDYYNKAKEVNTKLSEDIKKLNDEYENALKTRADSIYNFSGIFDEMQSKAPVKGSQLINNLKDQVKEIDNWDKALDKLKKRSVDTGLIEELENLGPSYATEITSISKMSDTQLKEYVELWRKKHELAKNQATEELEGLRRNTTDKIAEMTKNATTELEKYKTAWKTKIAELTGAIDGQLEVLKVTGSEAGTDLITNLITGVESMKAPLQEKIKEITGLINDVISKFNKLEGVKVDAAIKSSMSTATAKASGTKSSTTVGVPVTVQGNVVGTNGIKELTNIISKGISDKFSLSIGGW